MKIFLAAYCFGGRRDQTLIGVYKRCLRVGLRAVEMGHEVVMHCSGRQFYSDGLTRRAEAEFTFVDIQSPEPGGAYRRAAERRLAEIRPDLVVLGEAPLSGNFLSICQAAASRRLPIVILDNAYSPPLARNFIRDHGGVCDGLVLTGLSSCHMPDPPDYVCQVGPFIRSPTESSGAEVLSGLAGERLMTVLGYDEKAARLGLAIAERACERLDGVVLIVQQPEAWAGMIARLPARARAFTRVLPPPDEGALFALIRQSRLVVAKYGFMQLTECLALGAPVVMAYHEGLRWLSFLPPGCRQHVVACEEEIPDGKVWQAVEALLDRGRLAPGAVHESDGDAAAAAAQFLAGVRRRCMWPDMERKGFTRAALAAAMESRFGAAHVEVEDVRGTLIHRSPLLSNLYSLVCHARIGCFPEVVYLWGRRYATRDEAEADHRAARADPRRKVLHYSASHRLLIEVDREATDLRATIEQPVVMHS
jgi:hypothetical protein